MSIVCITNDVPDLRPCVVKGAHAGGCSGFATRWDRDLEKRVWTNDECAGCLPVLAEHGLLCWSCWEKLADALKKSVDIITHLRSVDRAAQLDNAGVRSAAGWVIPVPNTWRTADDLLVLLGHPTPGFPSNANVWEVEAITERYVDDLDAAAWVSRVHGAEDAARFTATMASALIQHPMEDYEHRVRNVRCWQCGQHSLLWKPPLMFHQEIRIECTNPACGIVVDQTGYGWMSELERLDVKTRLAAERNRLRVNRRAQAKAARAAAVAESLAELARKQAIIEAFTDGS